MINLNIAPRPPTYACLALVTLMLQENKWGWAEKRLRKVEADTDDFNKFKKRVVEVCNSYTGAENLIAGMPGRIERLLDRKGANIGK